MLGGKGNLSIERMSLQIISALRADCEGDWCLWVVIKSLQLNNKSVMLTLLILMKVITTSSSQSSHHHGMSPWQPSHCGKYFYPPSSAARVARLRINLNSITFEDNNKLFLCRPNVLGQNKNCVQFKFYSTGNKPGCLLLVFQNILC